MALPTVSRVAPVSAAQRERCLSRAHQDNLLTGGVEGGSEKRDCLFFLAGLIGPMFILALMVKLLFEVPKGMSGPQRGSLWFR